MTPLEVILALAIMVGFPCATIILVTWMIIRSKK